MWLALALSAAVAADGYLRQPDIHGDTIVFVAEDDLWTVASTGGEARRLTAHPGYERSPRISPDGKLVAFSAEYDGNVDTYVVPIGGGEPTRLTWHPSVDDPVAWSPDGQWVIFRSLRTDPNGSWRLYQVPVGGGDAAEVPVGYAARVDIDAESGQWALTRGGREGATWKRYRGGTADDIWVGDPRTGFTQVTTFDGNDAFPMWHGGRVYFLTDEGGTANLWSMKPDGTDRHPETKHTDWDVRWPGMGPGGRVVYMLGGDLWLFDPKSGADARVPVSLPGERRTARVRYPNVFGYLNSLALSPDADRVLLTSRGEIVSVPVKPGVPISVTQSSGARESWASYSPDGKRVLYVTDASGEEAIVSADAWGRGDEKVVVPAGTKGWHFPPIWSPDGKRIAWTDETYAIYVAPADGSAAPKQIDRATQDEIREYSFSPDGRYLAYVKLDSRNFQTLWIWDSSDGSLHQVGQGTTDDSSPVWDPDGRYLYFLSSRYTNPIFGARDFAAVLSPESQPYAILLKKDTPNPFAANQGLPPATPQAEAEKAKKDKKKKDKKAEEQMLDPTQQPLPAVAIDWDGLDDRIVAFPVAAGNFYGLDATAGHVFWSEYPWLGANEPGGGPDGATIWSFDLDARKANPFLDGVRSFVLQPKAKKALVLTASGLFVVDSEGGGADLTDAQVDVSGVVIELDPVAEWRQIFLEAWRNERDFFWDANLGGLDWVKLRDQYLALVPRLSSRSDLVDLLGELIGELATSHTYVGGGDSGALVGRVWNGLLGCDAVREGNAFKIARIYEADPADNVDSPLREPGGLVREGEYIVAVDRTPVKPGVPLEAMLQGRGGKRVLLTVAPKADGKNARDVAVTALWDESALRHADWVRHNREYVAEKSGGKLGYIHVPDMGTGGLTAFETWLYPQSDKQGMIVDIRWNRGGFVSQLLLEQLMRPLLGWNLTRYGGVYRYPQAQVVGPMAVVTNEFAGSDGDIFPKAVQVSKLAPLIGERTWGGVIGIRGDKPLNDQGYLSQPEYAFFFRDGGWGVENHGVDPDIVVAMTPQDSAAGRDPQLDRAIAEVMQAVAANPPPTPENLPDRPTKTREEFQRKEGGAK